MGTFNTKAILNGNPSLIPAIADRLCAAFAADGYEINRDNLYNGGVDISITKGGVFKAVLGMKTALKITLIPQGNSISFEAGVGIFGQQAIPTIIMLFFAWPVLLTQIWGLVQQSSLDDKALAIAQAVISENRGGDYYSESSFQSVPQAEITSSAKFCTNCGNPLPAAVRFCPNCGHQLH